MIFSKYMSVSFNRYCDTLTLNILILSHGPRWTFFEKWDRLAHFGPLSLAILSFACFRSSAISKRERMFGMQPHGHRGGWLATVDSLATLQNRLLSAMGSTAAEVTCSFNATLSASKCESAESSFSLFNDIVLRRKWLWGMWKDERNSWMIKSVVFWQFRTNPKKCAMLVCLPCESIKKIV